jgi:D-alanyl-D-alanine carboxypeptidase
MTRPPLTKSPFISSGRRREHIARRRRRRRWQLFGVAIFLLAIVAALIVASKVSNLSDTAPVGGRTRLGHSGAKTGSQPHVTQLSGLPAAPGPSGPLAAPLVLKLTTPHNIVHLRFKHPPGSGVLFDLNTGKVLWRHYPLVARPIASLTKMMTALLVVRSAPSRAEARITRQVLAYHGSGVGVLPRGKNVRVETLLNGLLLPSGNDAAIALAQHVAGTVSRFVERMNTMAAQLGLRCTHFASVDGFNDAGRSCAADLAVLARADLNQPRIAQIARRRHAVEPLPIKGGKVFLYNNNPLVIKGYPGIDGLKTGYTVAAGHCLVATARRHGVWLGVVLLRSPDTAKQAMQLLNQGFRIESHPAPVGRGPGIE